MRRSDRLRRRGDGTATRGQQKATLPELRQAYELLVQKVLVLLQDSDPPLAREIAASREAIWGLPADPQKFAAV